MSPTAKLWLMRIGLATWAIVTLILVAQVANLSDLLSDSQVEAAMDLNDRTDFLGALLVPLAATTTKKDFVADLRRVAPSETVRETDSSAAVGQITFHFNRAGVLDNVLANATP